ncbi:MAG: hypothetical protein BWZ01_03042 [Deltaproteobacteria bacterium ADurb.BinA179]|nr:MAG: hypothetical protein BWZ01_03042 [Deltaproteobacteria bacterium ADurb.BinA179]
MKFILTCILVCFCSSNRKRGIAYAQRQRENIRGTQAGKSAYRDQRLRRDHAGRPAQGTHRAGDRRTGYGKDHVRNGVSREGRDRVRRARGVRFLRRDRGRADRQLRLTGTLPSRAVRREPPVHGLCEGGALRDRRVGRVRPGRAFHPPVACHQHRGRQAVGAGHH